MNAVRPWRRLGPSHVTAAAALRDGAALLDDDVDAAGPATAWWTVSQDALVLGRGSRVAADEAACRAAGVAVVRRVSGGGPVLWGPKLLAVDILIGRTDPRFENDVVAAYRWVGDAIAAALDELGVTAQTLTPEHARALNDPRLSNLACYAGFSPWEVVVDDRKVVGLSQVRRRTGVLVQAGLVLQNEPARLPGLLALDDTDRDLLRRALAAHTVGLNALGVHDVRAIRDAVERSLHATDAR